MAPVGQEERLEAAPPPALPPDLADDVSRRGGLLQRLRIASWGPPVLVLVLALVLWEVVVDLTNTPSYLIAKPTEMFSATVHHFGLLMNQMVPTLIEVVLGFACSVAIALPIAIFIVYSRAVGKAVYPLVVASQVVPKVAIAPVFVILLGTGLFPKLILAFLIAFFPIVINTVTGLQGVDREMLEMVRSMGAGQARAFAKVRFPAALPSTFAGLKIAMTLAVVGAVVAEFVGASKGLGYSLLVAQGNVDTALVYADLLVMTVMGLVLYGALEVLEAILLRGRRAPTAEAAGRYSM
jgi:NitT/TauT family transport system permease protein